MTHFEKLSFVAAVTFNTYLSVCSWVTFRVGMFEMYKIAQQAK